MYHIDVLIRHARIVWQPTYPRLLLLCKKAEIEVPYYLVSNGGEEL